ncbi:MAG: C4-dicarboxylate ABC transporter, partial [Candidatus Competibacteraceae bacterium]|nr:C4-dicarboxylate ABC transporter [Candidatus Competibacteraceae bacterium]
MKTCLKSIVTTVTVASVLTFASIPDADAKKLRWKLHAAFGQNVAVIGPPPHRVAEAVKRMSDGDFDIKVFEPGALTGGYAYYDPVSQGAIDAAFGTP